MRAILTTLPYKIKQNHENEQYKDYVTKCLQVLTENTAGLVKEGKYITTSYSDLIHPPKPKAQQTPESIINNIKKKIEEMR